MVGIYAKIRNGWNWLKDKVKNKVIPLANKALDFANSDFAQGMIDLGGTALNAFAPGAGTALKGGLQGVIGLGNNAREIGNKAQEVWNSNKPRVPKGINLASRPGELNPRIQLKNALMPPEEEEEPTPKYSMGLLPRGPRVEELD
jgi:hypothetical protein